MKRFDPAKAALLDDPARFEYLSLETVFALLDAPRGSLVVDYGTGTGAFAIPLARARPDLRIVAYDVEPRMLALAQAKLDTESAPNVRTESTLDPSLNGAVARVLGINVLHELEPADLASIHALLAGGGRFVSIDWNARERPVGPPPERVYDVATARTFVEDAGFRVLAQTQLRFHDALVAEKAP